MSSESGSPSAKEILAVSDEDDAASSSLASLQARFDALEDKYNEMKFLFLLVLVVLFNAHVFGSMENWAAALVIGVIQLFGIVVLADRCRVNTVRPLIDRMAGITGRIVGNESNAGKGDAA